MRNTSVEILLACYNGELYIREQMDSILAQTDTRWHLTVSDDGSTDGTLEILDEYVRRYPERITRVYSGQRFGGARDHFFWLIGQCDADYMMTCDQDDRWYPQRNAVMMKRLLEAERRYGADVPLLVFSDQTPTDGRLAPIAPSLMRYQNQFFENFDYRSILMQNVVTGGAMAFNRALADCAMRCADGARTIMHDWWMAAVAARFGHVLYIDEPLSDYRQHGHNSVGAKRVDSASYVGEKLSALGSVRADLMKKKAQAGVFRETYAPLLTEEDEAFLCLFLKPHSGPLFYWRHRRLIHGFFRLTGMMILG